MKLRPNDFFPLLFIVGSTCVSFSIPLGVFAIGDLFDGSGVGIGQNGEQIVSGLMQLGSSLIAIGFIGALFIADYRVFVRGLLVSFVIPPLFSLAFLFSGGFAYLVVQNIFQSCVDGANSISCEYKKHLLMGEKNARHLEACLSGYFWNCQQLDGSRQIAEATTP